MTRSDRCMTTFLTMTDEDLDRAIACVDALAGIKDVEGFMEEVREILTNITTEPYCNNAYYVTGGALKALALFPRKDKENED